MTARKIANLPDRGPLIVASITTHANLKIALQSPPAAVDWFEIRADCWATRTEEILPLLSTLTKPSILTVRHPKEGGANNLPRSSRIELFETFLPFTQAVDIELRSTSALEYIIKTVRKGQIPLIFSHHDFQGTPPLKKMLKLAREARDAGASVFKLAVTASKPAHVARLLDFLSTKEDLPLSVMGMGPMGKLSRLACATAGSLFNYAFLDRATVPGQWPAATLRERIQEIMEPEG